MSPNPRLAMTPEELAAALDNPKVHIFDCSVQMTPQPVGPSVVESGRPAWEKGHILGAQYLHMVDDLAEPEAQIAYKLPRAERIGTLLSRYGVNDGDTVVLYGTGYPAVVTRAFWVLTASGADDVRLLNGGLPAWIAAGLPLSDAVAECIPGNFHAQERPAVLATRDQVVVAMDDPSVVLVNALSREQFTGTGGAHYGRPGRIPGSVGLPVRDLFDAETLKFRSAAEIEQVANRAGLSPDQRLIIYCGGGIAASGVFFALKLAGYPDVALYDGSLLEWSSFPSLPLVCG